MAWSVSFSRCLLNCRRAVREFQIVAKPLSRALIISRNWLKSRQPFKTTASQGASATRRNSEKAQWHRVCITLIYFHQEVVMHEKSVTLPELGLIAGTR